MDVLTHLFLPLTVVYVLRPELFDTPASFALGGFAILPDFDKVLGQPGVLHSLLTLVPIGALVLGVEWRYRNSITYSGLAVALIGSHLVLDVIDGGPVPLLFPLIEQGIGLTYPVQTVLGAEPTPVGIDGPVTQIQVEAPRQSRTTYPLVDGAGIASLLTFLAVYVGLRRQGQGVSR